MKYLQKECKANNMLPEKHPLIGGEKASIWISKIVVIFVTQKALKKF